MTGRGVEAFDKLTTGPGRLTEALGITKPEFNNQPISNTRLSVFDTTVDYPVKASPRIGISTAEDWPLRFTAQDNEFISKPILTDVTLNEEAVENAYRKLESETQERLF